MNLSESWKVLIFFLFVIFLIGVANTFLSPKKEIDYSKENKIGGLKFIGNKDTQYYIGTPVRGALMLKISPYPLDGKTDFNVQINSKHCEIINEDNNFFTYFCKWSEQK